MFPAMIGAIAATRAGSTPPPPGWWQKTPMPALASAGTGWSNITVRVRFDIGAATGGPVRIRFVAPPGGAFSVSKVFAQAGASNYGFKTAPVELKFGGSSGFSLPAGQQILSDDCAITILPGDFLVVAMHITSAVAAQAGGNFLYARHPVVYANGDDTSNASPSGYTASSVQWLGVDGVEAAQALPEWADAWSPGSFVTPSSWSGYTLRVVIPKTMFLGAEEAIRAWFYGGGITGSVTTNIVAAYIGLSSGSPTYAFSSAPTQLLFSAGASVAIPVGEVTMSDEAALSIDGTRDVVVSFYMTTSGVGSPKGFATPPGFGCYYKSGNDAATVGASGYSSYGDFPSFCRLQAR